MEGPQGRASSAGERKRMSFAQHERGEFIRSKMNHYILMALGKGKINAEEAGRIFDLISGVETSGSTHNSVLVRERIYLKAIGDWKKVRERRRKKYEQKNHQRL